MTGQRAGDGTDTDAGPIDTDDRRPHCIIVTVTERMTWAWITRTVELDRVLVALAEIGMTPDRVARHDEPPVGTPMLRYNRVLTGTERDHVERAVRLARRQRLIRPPASTKPIADQVLTAVRARRRAHRARLNGR